jgi:nucleotide-binding universal stress UspA family protein
MRLRTTSSIERRKAMYHSILVPLEGSAFAEQALPVAFEIARRSSASVTLLRVHVPLAPAFAEGYPPFEYHIEQGVRERATTYIQDVARRYADPKVPVTPLVLDGTVTDTVCDHVRSSGTDLVVLSTHGRGPLARFWLGSVADELIRKLRLPVLAVHPHEEGSVPSNKFRHILIPLDGSPLSEEIIEPAVALGVLGNAEYTLVRFISPTIIGGATISDVGGVMVDETLLHRLEEVHAEARREAETYLRAIAEGLRKRGLKVQTRVLDSEQPALAVLAQARDLKADLIAIATHGRSGVNRLLLGSVADKVLRGASVPVLLDHPITEAKAAANGHASKEPACCS